MTIQPGAVLYTQGLGSRPEGVEVPHLDVRAPTIYDIKFPVGKRWIDQVGQSTYTLVDFISTSNVVQAVWVQESASSTFASITAQNFYTADASTGLDISANEITALGTSTNIDIELNPKGSGDVTVSTGDLVLSAGTLQASAASTLSCGPVNCSYVTMAGASAKLYISAVNTATSSIGTATLVAGTVTVANTNVTAASKIFLTVASLGTVTAPQAVYVSTIVAGTSFAITSADATDTSTVNWFIIN